MKSASLLLIEHSNALRTLCQSWHDEDRFTLNSAQPADAVETCRRLQPTAILSDLRQTGTLGLELVRRCLRASPSSRFLLIGRDDRAQEAVAAIRAGAHDYLSVPIRANDLRCSLRNALGTQTERSTPAHVAEFIGESEKMLQVYDQIHRMAKSDAPVFITGECGTGKELCARAIHRLSERADKPFISLKCNGIGPDTASPETSLSVSECDAAILSADGGTLFLDNVCDLDGPGQNRLLHALQTGTLPDGNGGRRFNVRILSSCDQGTSAANRPATLRSDLYYRLNVLRIAMPPLRERDRDVLILADHALKRYAQAQGPNFTGFDGAAQTALLRYPWPGNVLELDNMLRQITVMYDGSLIRADMLPTEVATAAESPAPAAEESSPQDSDHVMLENLLGRRMLDIERKVIEATIQIQGGSVPRAADVLGLSPSTIYRKRETWR